MIFIDTFFSHSESFTRQYVSIRLNDSKSDLEIRDVRGVNSGPPLDDDFTVEGRYDTRRAYDSTFPENKG